MSRSRTYCCRPDTSRCSLGCFRLDTMDSTVYCRADSTVEQTCPRQHSSAFKQMHSRKAQAAIEVRTDTSRGIPVCCRTDTSRCSTVYCGIDTSRASQSAVEHARAGHQSVLWNWHVYSAHKSVIAHTAVTDTSTLGCAAHFRWKRKLADFFRLFFSLIFALSETLQESDNNESEMKILSEKLKRLKVFFKFLDSKLIWHLFRISCNHEKPLSHTAAQGVCSTAHITNCLFPFHHRDRNTQSICGLVWQIFIY